MSYFEEETRPKRRQKRTIYYRLWNNEATWEEASEYCSEQDGRLAKIEDASVQKRLVRSIKRKGFKGNRLFILQRVHSSNHNDFIYDTTIQIKAIQKCATTRL